MASGLLKGRLIVVFVFALPPQGLIVVVVFLVIVFFFFCSSAMSVG